MNIGEIHLDHCCPKYHYNYGSNEALAAIDSSIACVIMETVQAEAGVIAPSKEWIQAIRTKCNEHCVLLILDEIQCGFGRTGSLWAFEQFDIIPDVLLLGKALGGGMPMGAFIAHQSLMSTLTNNPVLGHITTFGGHPVSCAAGKAAFEFLVAEKCYNSVQEKITILLKMLKHPAIQSINHCGLWMALSLAISKPIMPLFNNVLQGLITDWFCLHQIV
jgi:acetylornithine/succinyldiaminopimelate/putrescine aminotransferase